MKKVIVVLIILQVLFLISCKEKEIINLEFARYCYTEDVFLRSVGNYKDKILDIPEKDNEGRLVVAISGYAFYENNTIEIINIPNSVISISKLAFMSCVNLKKIHIGAGVNDIGESIFAYCNELVEITIDENNKKYEAVNNCKIEKDNGVLVSGCRNSIIPRNIKKIGIYAFGGINTLENIKIPDSVMQIDNNAFFDCNSLKEIYLGENIGKIAPGAFLDCHKIKIYTAHTIKPDGWENDWDVINSHTDPYTRAETFWNTPKPIY